MKNLKALYFAGFFILLLNYTTIAQISSESDLNLILLREDRVVPSLVGEYEAALIDLKEFLTANKEAEFQYFCHLQDDYTFTHAIPVVDCEDVEYYKFVSWIERMNHPELDLIYDVLNSCIESTKYSMIQYMPWLSYVPESENWIEGLPYRKWSFYYFYPGTEDDVRGILSSWQSLYLKNDIPTGFRVFEGYLGTEQPMFIFTNWAENPMDHMEKLHENMELLGPEGPILWNLTMQYVRKVETIEGWFLPQFSYIIDKEFAPTN
jgi:hypothetical protein